MVIYPTASGEEFFRLKGLSKETCLIIPLTTSKNVHKLRPSIGLVENKEACVLLSQMKVIDTKRLVRKIGSLDKEIFESVKKLLKTCFNGFPTFCLFRGEAEATCIYYTSKYLAKVND